MDNQVAEFEDQEHEWAVDKITSHKGSKSDALFEVRWKSGDPMWLPYDQVEHLAALQEYFDALGVSNVSDLPDGAGSPPTNDPQVFLGYSGVLPSYRTGSHPATSTTLPRHSYPPPSYNTKSHLSGSREDTFIGRRQQRCNRRRRERIKGIGAEESTGGRTMRPCLKRFHPFLHHHSPSPTLLLAFRAPCYLPSTSRSGR